MTAHSKEKGIPFPECLSLQINRVMRAIIEARCMEHRNPRRNVFPHGWLASRVSDTVMVFFLLLRVTHIEPNLARQANVGGFSVLISPMVTPTRFG